MEQQLTNAQAQLAYIDEVLRRLNKAKPIDRSEEARCYAVTITEMEKARAYFKVYVVDVESGNQF